MKRIKRVLTVLLCVVMVTMMVVPVSADSGACLTMEYVNPLYAHLSIPSQSAIVKTQPNRAPTVYRNSLQEAAMDLREGMKNREKTIVVSFLTSEHAREMMQQLYDLAIVHTGEPKEGDYIHRHLQYWTASMTYYPSNGQYYNTVTFNINYLSTAEQEQEVDAAVQTLLDRLAVYNAGDYEKVSAVYDYICENISYDYSGTDLSHTAYAALIDGMAVCQGYASLFYRLALELDVDTRVVSGFGNGGPHGWNIVNLGGQYYNLDSTWDAGSKPYWYFLRSEKNFSDHVRSSEYLTTEFQLAYPMAQTDYFPQAYLLPGDLDSDGEVTQDDAIYLLQSILMPSVFPLRQAADYVRNGSITEEDAMYLLRHVLLPKYFPI